MLFYLFDVHVRIVLLDVCHFVKVTGVGGGGVNHFSYP